VACELLGNATMRRDFLSVTSHFTCDRGTFSKTHKAKF
jgi:hypothetical protein